MTQLTKRLSLSGPAYTPTGPSPLSITMIIGSGIAAFPLLAFTNLSVPINSVFAFLAVVLTGQLAYTTLSSHPTLDALYEKLDTDTPTPSEKSFTRAYETYSRFSYSAIAIGGVLITTQVYGLLFGTSTIIEYYTVAATILFTGYLLISKIAHIKATLGARTLQED